MARAQSGLHQLLLAREIGVVGSQESVPYQRSLHFPPHYAGKLSVAHTYNGHSGCVNRLAWNADGSLLVSGSDDRRAIIWHHPEVERTPLALFTEHRANIFGVQFLPCTGDRRVVTGAMDDTVQLHDLETSPATNIPRPGSAGGSRAQPPMHRRVASTAHLQSVMPRTKVYYSHKDRVKDVRVEPMNPHNFWSGGEDGVVRQYDTRQPNQDKWESPTVLVQVRDGHKTIQVKSLDINKAHPHLLAVAGADPQIRLYDRRKLSTGGWQRRGATPAVMALAPPHLPLAAAAPRHGRSHATYVAFSNRGDKLVTTYHGDHAYCFDITASGDVSAFFPDPAAALGVGIGAAAPPAAGGASGLLLVPQRQQSVTPSGRHHGSEAGGNGDRRDSGGGSSGGSGSASPLCPRAEEAKARGNAAMFERKWTAAVVAFTDALHWAPGAPALYAQRAEALLGRGWVGDAAMALRDCDTAVGLDESFSRAYLRRIHALQALQQYQCALTAVDEYQRRFPGRAADDVAALAVTLRAAVEERRRLYEARRQQQERRRAQRAAALARVQGRVDSPAVRPQMPGAATTSTTAAEAGASWAARGAAPAAAAAGAAAAAAPAAAAATILAAAGGGAAAAAAGSSTDDEMEDSEVYGPPPPPYDSVEEEADQGASAAGAALAPAGAEEAVSTASGAGHIDDLRAGKRQVGTGEGTAVGAEQATPTQRPPAAATSVEGQAAAGPSTCAVGDSVGASSPRELPQQQPSARTPAAEAGPAGNAEEPGAAAAGPSRSVAAAAGTDGHTRAAAGAAGPSADAEGSASEAETPAAEAEAEAAARAAAGRGRPPETASDALGPARRFLRGNEEDDDDDDEEAPEEEDEEEEEEEEEEEDTTDVDSLPGEEDPDMELFLQYYSRVMDMAGASGSAGASKAAAAAARHGHHSGTSTSAAAPAASGGDGRQGGYRIRGAWDGTPGGRRMLQRFVGQSNVQTDIKEVGFIGSDDAVVAAGSDCGRVFLYDAASGAVLRALPADEDVANCVQCHPSLPVIATSGIETVVRLWSPSDTLPSPAAVRELTDELDGVVGRNQERMKEGPSMLRASALQQALQENPQLWQLLMSQLYGRGVMGARGRPGSGGGGGAAAGPAPGAADEPGGEDDDEEDAHPEVSCRMA